MAILVSFRIACRSSLWAFTLRELSAVLLHHLKIRLNRNTRVLFSYKQRNLCRKMGHSQPPYKGQHIGQPPYNDILGQLPFSAHLERCKHNSDLFKLQRQWF